MVFSKEKEKKKIVEIKIIPEKFKIPPSFYSS
jgi:hypothetical protein